MDVVGEAAGAGSQHKNVAELCVIVQNRANLFERCLVFCFAPHPVPMNIRIVGIEALIRRQARSQCQVAFVIALQGLHFDGLQQFLQMTAGGLLQLSCIVRHDAVTARGRSSFCNSFSRLAISWLNCCRKIAAARAILRASPVDQRTSTACLRVSGKSILQALQCRASSSAPVESCRSAGRRGDCSNVSHGIGLCNKNGQS